MQPHRARLAALDLEQRQRPRVELAGHREEVHLEGRAAPQRMRGAKADAPLGVVVERGAPRIGRRRRPPRRRGQCLRLARHVVEAEGRRLRAQRQRRRAGQRSHQQEQGASLGR
jgi:hypothetical protein